MTSLTPDEPEQPRDEAVRTLDVAEEEHPYLHTGRFAWATIGFAGVLVILGFVVGRLSLVVIPVLLALFPAALLMPLAHLLKRIGLPPALASLLTMLTLLGGLVAVGFGITLLVQSDLPELREDLGEGVSQLEETIASDPLGLGYEFEGFDALLSSLRERVIGGGGDAAGQGGGGGEGGGGGDGQGDGGQQAGGMLAGGPLGAATAVTEGLTGLVLLFVVLFFYLKDEGRLSDGVILTLPRSWHRHATELAHRFWTTVGAYFRMQIVVALVDAVAIGIGLLLLGVPLALPLSVLIFFGALFPIVGAFVSGAVAVLVALADSGVVTALLVLGLIVLVQQLEGNVLQPALMSNAIDLHPLVVLLALTAGSVLLGILGAFLAVPIAAGFARSLDYARHEIGRRPLLPAPPG